MNTKYWLISATYVLVASTSAAYQASRPTYQQTVDWILAKTNQLRCSSRRWGNDTDAYTNFTISNCKLNARLILLQYREAAMFIYMYGLVTKNIKRLSVTPLSTLVLLGCWAQARAEKMTVFRCTTVAVSVQQWKGTIGTSSIWKIGGGGWYSWSKDHWFNECHTPLATCTVTPLYYELRQPSPPIPGVFITTLDRSTGEMVYKAPSADGREPVATARSSCVPSADPSKALPHARY